MWHDKRTSWAFRAAIVGMVAAVGLVAQRASADTLKTPGVQPREVVLDNGLTLLLVERREEPTVAAGVFYDVGSVNDPRGKSGIAHLFEHMLFKGSKIIGTTNYEAERTFIAQQDRLRARMNAEMDRMRLMKRRGKLTDVLDPKQWTLAYGEMHKQYSKLVASARQYVKNNEFANLYTTNGGARLNAGTMHDLTLYFVQLPANKIELFFWLESDRMGSGIMREFYVERDNVREERRLRVESTPTGRFDEAFESMFWQAHPYGIPVIGWPSEVESITREDVRDFYGVYYAPNNATVVLVGDFKTNDMVALAKKYFGRIPRGANDPPLVITEEVAPQAERRFYAEAETNPRVRVRYHGVAIGHTDEAALEVVGALLSGKTGRLFKRLVTKEDVALGEPYGGHQGRKYAGHFEISVTVKEGRALEEVERMVLEEVARLGDGDISDHELQKVKNQVLAGSIRRLKSNFGLMFQLGIYDTWTDWRYINASPQAMLAVTADDVRRVVQAYLKPKTRTVAIYTTLQRQAAVDETSASADQGRVSPPSSDQAEAAAEEVPEDPELTAIMATLPRKFQKELEVRLIQLESMDDLLQIDVMASVFEDGLENSRIKDPDRIRLFEYVISRMRERQFMLRHLKDTEEQP